MVGGDFFITTTIGTKAFAKWQVDINADAIMLVFDPEFPVHNIFPGGNIN